MTEHRIVLVIDAVYRTDDPQLTIRHLVEKHYAVTAKRAQPFSRMSVLLEPSATELINSLERIDAPE
jgi:hypothetical protein